MTSIKLSEARAQFGELVNRAHYAHDIIYLARRNTPIAAIVSADAARTLEQVEDLRDALEAKLALLEHRESGGETITVAELRKMLETETA